MISREARTKPKEHLGVENLSGNSNPAPESTRLNPTGC
jgi:hypothetical protein